MKVHWKKSDKFWTVDIDGSKVEIAVTNYVRGRRMEDPEDVQKTIPGGHPYMPLPFPVGNWEITGCFARSSDYLAPFFISTNAKQKVVVWSLDPDGSYGKPTTKMVWDEAYGAHSSTSSTTLGCVRILFKSDTIWLASQIMSRMKNGKLTEKIPFIVEE